MKTFLLSETQRKRTTVLRKNSNSMTTWPSIPTIPAIQDFGLAKKLFRSSDRVLKKVDGTHGEVMPGRVILTNHIQRTCGWNILEGDWYSEDEGGISVQLDSLNPWGTLAPPPWRRRENVYRGERCHNPQSVSCVPNNKENSLFFTEFLSQFVGKPITRILTSMGHPNFLISISHVFFLRFWCQCPNSCPNYPTHVFLSSIWKVALRQD